MSQIDSATTPTLRRLADDLASGATTSRKLVEDCLQRIGATQGEGSRAFVRVMASEARAAADAMDALRKVGAQPSRFAGIPVSVKDLFDVAGQVTKAGSKALAGHAPAANDAVAVARLRRAGFVVIGRTNMTEFAFSGVGLNPHYGTPKSVWDRATGRIPGGSSSGAAVSVVDRMAYVGLGTDTGGSCRIPAAFNGIVGFKPTASRVPTAGAVPLSHTLDSVGPLANTVACCASVDAILAGDPQRTLRPVPMSRLRVGVPNHYVLDGMDDTVARDFERALGRLAEAGARVERIAVPELNDLPTINAKAGFAAPEALVWHQPLIDKRASEYDPRVLVRIKRGQEQSAVDYINLLAERARFIAAVEARLGGIDVIAMPTVPMEPPPIAALEKDEDFGRINLLALRNPTVINILDGCAISVPMNDEGAAPTGLMLSMMRGRDRALFDVAAAVETAIAV